MHVVYARTFTIKIIITIILLIRIDHLVFFLRPNRCRPQSKHNTARRMPISQSCRYIVKNVSLHSTYNVFKIGTWVKIIRSKLIIFHYFVWLDMRDCQKQFRKRCGTRLINLFFIFYTLYIYVYIYRWFSFSSLFFLVPTSNCIHFFSSHSF